MSGKEPSQFEHFGEVAMAASSPQEAQAQAAQASAAAHPQPSQAAAGSSAVELAQAGSRPSSSARTTIAVVAAAALMASLLGGAAYLVISNNSNKETPSAVNSRPAAGAASDEATEEQHDGPRVPPSWTSRPDTVAAVRAQFSGHRRHSMTPYLYQVSSDRSFAEAVGHHDTLRQELAKSVLSDDTEAALVMHKNGKYFCNVVLWKPPIRPPEWILDSMRTLLGEGAMLRSSATYCVCPQAAWVERPDQDGRIEVVWCHDTEYGACPLPPPD